MTTMYVLVRVCIWTLGLYKLEALGVLVGFLEFCSLVVANLLSLCLCLFDTITSLLHVRVEKHSTLSHWKAIVTFMCNKGFGKVTVFIFYMCGGNDHIESLV